MTTATEALKTARAALEEAAISDLSFRQRDIISKALAEIAAVEAPTSEPIGYMNVNNLCMFRPDEVADSNWLAEMVASGEVIKPYDHAAPAAAPAEQLIDALLRERVDYEATRSPEDFAYNQAVSHCIAAVRRELAAPADLVAQSAVAGEPSAADLDAFDYPKALLKREDWDAKTRKPKVEPAKSAEPSVPSSLAQQVAKATAEMATWTPERLAAVQLQGGATSAEPAPVEPAGVAVDERAEFDAWAETKYPLAMQSHSLGAYSRGMKKCAKEGFDFGVALSRQAAPAGWHADLTAIDAAMQHMGDALNAVDAVEEGDEEATKAGFEAIARLLAAAPTSPGVAA